MIRVAAPEPFVIPGTFAPGRQPDGNTVIFEAPAGLVIVNTHWHLDHVEGANELLRDGGGEKLCQPLGPQ